MCIFEKSVSGRHTSCVPHCRHDGRVPDEFRPGSKLHTPELSKSEVIRRYTELAGKTHGANDGFY
ncbi:MAG: hypothetical protein HUJ51_05675 [Eggerthellaceae bacterium]|nr:hypothetical protein [Eggerthellaceae bacterium]